MRVCIDRSNIKGCIKAPRSKSHAIRLIFSSLLSPIEILDLPGSDDVKAAINAVKALGVTVNGNRFELKNEVKLRSNSVYVGGSATVLRMLIPIVTVVGGTLEINCDESLKKRPLGAIVEALKDRGVYVSSDRPPVVVSGRLDDNWIKIKGFESSQYISGYMIAFCIKGQGEIYVEPPLVSKSYIHLTQEVLREFGCEVVIKSDKIEVARTASPKIVKKRVEGDYALSSFYAASALLTNGYLDIYDLPPPKDYFGDHSIVEVYRRMGAHSEYEEGLWKVKAEDAYHAIDIDVEDAPDLAPSIAPLAAIAEGTTRIRGVERLRIKESDRLSSIVRILQSFGATARFDGGSLIIDGCSIETLRPAYINCEADHRMAMMASTLALRVGGVIDNAQCVNKSNPSFWRDLLSIGGRLKIEDN